jgi:hypothetical protein
LLSRLECRCVDAHLRTYMVEGIVVPRRYDDLSVSPWTHYLASTAQIMKK